MTTRYDRMRRAAHLIQSGCIADSPADELAQQLRADADEFERVEREMRSDNPSYTVWAISNGQADDWADRIRGGQMSNNVPLLTAEMAVLLRTYDPSVARPQLLAIADGRAVVMPRMTEAEARERLIAWLRSEVGRLGGEWMPSPQQTWIAALRDIGAIRD